ncbi:MAG: hypothetical protein JRJ12_06790 [Deltaproteobacteria bacterium]|nr:hypothetical protein [Deltaproteobacteria bacterium]MBW2071101.1 hypothetical protein [Deltaproteobacteria bacterium]
MTIMTPQGPKRGVTKNIGPKGAFIATEYPLSLHDKICVVIKTPRRPALVVNTIVVRSEIEKTRKERSSSGAAVYFLELTEEELRFLYAEIAAGDAKEKPPSRVRCFGCGQHVSTFKTCAECGAVTCTGCLKPLANGTVLCPVCEAPLT